jgi:endonuclease-3
MQSLQGAENARRAKIIIERLKTRYPQAICSLESGDDPWRLLIMTRLSAQCTDERVNIVSRTLFAKYPSAEALAAADQTAVEAIIFPCGLFRTKSASIIGISKTLVEAHGGRVPSDMEALLALPGVGRKTANLVRGDIFALGGIVADTHCIRISGRLGLTKSADPGAVERDLAAIIPTNEQTNLCHRMVMFGREVCTARTPKCAACELNDICSGVNK